jgi:hypothetical protein
MSDKIINLTMLRDFLSEELKKVSSGVITPATANATANLAGKILSSVKLELEYNKLCGTPPKIGFVKIKNNDKLIENKKA